MSKQLTSMRAFGAYLAILGSMLMISAFLDRVVHDPSAKELANILVVAAGMVAVLVVVGLFFRKNDAVRVGGDGRVRVRRPSPARQWKVAALSSVIAVTLWIVLIDLGRTISHPGVQPLVLYQLPFVTAGITTVGILALGPLRYRGERLRRVGDWLPLAILLSLACAGVILMPALAIVLFDGAYHLNQYSQQLLPGFLAFPSLAAFIRYLRTAPP